MKEVSYTEIGSLSKSWGNQGLILANIYGSYSELVKADSFIFIRHDGLYVPYYIEKVSSKGSKTHVKFEDIENAKTADALKSMKVFLKTAELPITPATQPPDDSIEILIGYTIFNEEDKVGQIKVIESMPEQDIAVVVYKGTEVMIPLVEDLVLEVDNDEKVIVMKLPEGLLDL